MTPQSRKQNTPKSPAGSRRQDRMLPVELLGISLALGIFTGLTVLVATREFLLAGVALGVAFIVSLVLFALFALEFKPSAAELSDLNAQNSPSPSESSEANHDRDDPGSGRDTRP